MTIESLITMLLIMGLLWGGLAALILIALGREAKKSSD